MYYGISIKKKKRREGKRKETRKFLKKQNNLYCLKSGEWGKREPSRASGLLIMFGFLVRLPAYTGVLNF